MIALEQSNRNVESKVKKANILVYVKNLILESEDGKAEVSAKEIADKFNYHPQTVIHYLEKLIEERHFVQVGTGKYRKKILALPNEQRPRAQVFDNAEEFVEHAKKVISRQKKEQKEEPQNEVSHEEVLVEEPATEEAVQAEKEEKKEQQKENSVVENQEEHAPVENQLDLEPKELTLDEKIERFIQQSKLAQQATEYLLKQKDKEILAVINESIQQNILYLKDLAEQLSTIENKELIQSLIDDRNANLKRISELEEEVQSLRHRLDEIYRENQKVKNAIDPQRVRAMQSRLIAILDNYVELPNHAISLQRREFRKQMIEEITHLCKYVLGLEK